MSDLSDGQIVAGCLAGRRQAWDLFLKRYARLIFWNIRRAVAGSSFAKWPGLCEEIFQDVFRRLLEGELEKIKSAANLKSFLCLFATHRTLDRLKALKRSQGRFVSVESLAAEKDGEAEELPGETDSVVDDSESISRKERQAITEEVVSELGARERFCLEAHYVDGKSHRQIGELLGIPPDTVSTVIRRAKERLKARLEEKGL